ncbi:MAG: IclR family transcriptional regulator [Rhodospirillaceae bacterium]
MALKRKNLTVVHNASRGDGPAARDEASERHDRLNELGVTGKAFSILEAITARSDPTPLAEIIRMTGITKPTAHRIVNLLMDMGLVERDSTDLGFTEGAQMINLAHRTVAAAAPRSLRRAVLKSLSEDSGETCNFGILSGAEVIYLDRVEAQWPLGLRFETGSHVPAHCTAIGKLLLSRQSDEYLEELLSVLPLTRYTDFTLTEIDDLMAALNNIRRDGIGTDDQEFMTGVVCVAVPIEGSDGFCYGGVAISAPEARMSLNQALGIVPQMRQAARRLANTYRSPRPVDKAEER